MSYANYMADRAEVWRARAEKAEAELAALRREAIAVANGSNRGTIRAPVLFSMEDHPMSDRQEQEKQPHQPQPSPSQPGDSEKEGGKQGA